MYSIKSCSPSPSESPPQELNHANPQLFASYATETYKGIKPKRNSNSRTHVNQDRSIIIPQLPQSSNTAALFGVFDGHGKLGHHVSKYLSHKMRVWFSQHKSDSDLSDSLQNCFAWLTAKLTKSVIDCLLSGSTAVIVCVDNDQLYTANVGDSRAILAREEFGQIKAIPLSSDHKPEDSMEKKRIESNGGRVQPQIVNGKPSGPHRVWLKDYPLPGLAMSRSFGDDMAADVGVCSEPEIIITERSKCDKFMVVATDGIWDFLSNQEVVDIVNEYTDSNEACVALCKAAKKRWLKKANCVDDITAVVVFLRC